MTAVEQKMAVKFKLSAADVTVLMAAGMNTPVKVRAAAKDSKLPGTLSLTAKAVLEGRFKK
jgi:hypothetical protein